MTWKGRGWTHLGKRGLKSSTGEKLVLVAGTVVSNVREEVPFHRVDDPQGHVKGRTAASKGLDVGHETVCFRSPILLVRLQ